VPAVLLLFWAQAYSTQEDFDYLASKLLLAQAKMIFYYFLG